MYAWEHSFAKLIEEARKAEINVIQKSCFYKAFNMCFFFTSARLVMALIFLTYVLMGEILTAEKAFLTLALYNVARLSMSLFFPTGIQLASEVEFVMRMSTDQNLNSIFTFTSVRPSIRTHPYVRLSHFSVSSH